MRAEPALCRTLPYGRRERIWELDYLRGACIVLMILYHAMYDLRTFALDWQRQSGAFAELYELAALFLRSPFLHLRDFVAPAFFSLRESPLRLRTARLCELPKCWSPPVW